MRPQAAGRRPQFPLAECFVSIRAISFGIEGSSATPKRETHPAWGPGREARTSGSLPSEILSRLHIQPGDLIVFNDITGLHAALIHVGLRVAILGSPGDNSAAPFPKYLLAPVRLRIPLAIFSVDAMQAWTSQCKPTLGLP